MSQMHPDGVVVKVTRFENLGGLSVDRTWLIDWVLELRGVKESPTFLRCMCG